MTVRIEESWRSRLQGEFDSPYFAALAGFVRNAYRSGAVYPPAGRIFEAFDLTPFESVKVVIVGQDPYHGPNQAHGLSFSVQPGVAVPPSLENIYRELEVEFGRPFRGRNGDLRHWAGQGVLLLNATLTVAAGQAGSHQGRGWETFTDAALKTLAAEREHLVFMLWGSPARRKGAFIDRARHLVLEAPHPSPLSAYRGFFGCNHFKLCNEYLASHSITPIVW